uniref:Uncharacterized protein n=1 Tax=Catagonus wagneri TaxID=51154 RepID=A0A8C3X403_9CETA
SWHVHCVFVQCPFPRHCAASHGLSLISLYNLVFASPNCSAWFAIYQLETVSLSCRNGCSLLGEKEMKGLSGFLLSRMIWMSPRPEVKPCYSKLI